MKKLLIILICLLPFFSQATDIYFANSGSDAGAGTSASPYATIAKLNLLTLSPGDNVYFKRGDTFYGEITVGQSGTSGSPITFGAYGTGALPVITGFQTISSWTNLGSNIWESGALTNTTSNVVMVNGVNTPMGRFPNLGAYNTVGSATASSITDASLGAINWTGAEVVVKVERYVINRATISSQSGTTINFTALGYVPPVGYKYFIQNDVRTLDQQNEWYYNPSTKKLRIYSTTSPTNVKSSQQDVLVLLHYVNYVTFDGIDFTGANLNAFSIGSSKHITIQNCNISYSGDRAIYGENYAANNYSYWLNINNCNLFNNTKQDIYLENYFKDASITNNTCKNTGLILGAESNAEPQATSIQVVGDSTNVQYNTLDSTGYIGIHFKGNFTNVQNNFINHFCLNRDDGGGIYTVGSPQFDGQKVLNNIVLNGKGSYEMATNPFGALYAEGIYLDDLTDSVEVGGNTIAYCGEAGIYLHQATHINVHNNLSFDNNDGQFYIRSSSNVRNLTVDNNQFISTGSENAARFYADNLTDVQSFGNFYNNYYARPIDDNTTIQTVVGGTEVDKTLAQWQTYSSLDAGSLKSPIAITNSADLILKYNTTNSSAAQSLSYTYQDVAGTAYNSGSITLSPYTGAALIKTGALAAAPTMTISGDQSISVNYTNITAIATPASGETITDYLWTKISGIGTITSNTSNSTGLTGLSGISVYQCTATQSDGQTVSRQVTITVVNAQPTANAGSDITIQLPTTSVTLTGSGTDADGTIASYLWAKISGGSVTIATPTASTTTVTGLLAQGTYIFTLTVTDNQGGQATDYVTVTVQAANVAPTANAGSNKTITLPTNSLTLSGSGTDIDGTISAYSWAKISGSSYSIDNANIASPTISGLSQGNYIFRLTVTDNQGATGTSDVTITVNSPPIARPGSNQVISLSPYKKYKNSGQ